MLKTVMVIQNIVENVIFTFFYVENSLINRKFK